MRTYIYLAIAVLEMLAGQSVRADCPDNARITIVFGNGIETTRDEAQNSLDNVLAPAILQALPPTVNQSCISFALAYDSQFVDSNNNVISTANFLAQLADAAAQRGIDFAANFWSYWYSAVQPPTWFQDLQRQFITSATSIFQPDLLTHEQFYSSELALGHTVIVVAHSQGNLYVNQAYAVVAPLVGGNLFHIVGVATPATSVAGSGPYFTLHGDIITLVPGSLLANITDDSPSPCQGVLFSVPCHSFDSSYMDLQNGDHTRPAIVNAVLSFLQRSVTYGYTFQGTFQVFDPASGTFSAGTVLWQFHEPSILTSTTTITNFDSAVASGALAGCVITSVELSPSTSPPSALANFAGLCGPGSAYLGAYTQFASATTSPGAYTGYTRAGVFEGNLVIQSGVSPTTYVFVGAPFNQFSNTSCPPTCRITGSITLAQPLPPNINLPDGQLAGSMSDFTPLSFSFTDGVTTATNQICPDTIFNANTDANGNITQYSMSVCFNHGGNYFFLFYYPPDTTQEGINNGSTYQAYFFGSSGAFGGTWSVP